MNELKPYADEIMAWLREGKEFVAEQTPELCEQLVARGLVTHGVTACVMLLLAISGGYLLWRGLKAGRVAEWRDGAWMIPAVIGAAVLFITLIISIVDLIRFLEILVAPKVYVLEELARIAGSAGTA
jgi:hypothetical protein